MAVKFIRYRHDYVQLLVNAPPPEKKKKKKSKSKKTEKNSSSAHRAKAKDLLSDSDMEIEDILKDEGGGSDNNL